MLDFPYKHGASLSLIIYQVLMTDIHSDWTSENTHRISFRPPIPCPYWGFRRPNSYESSLLSSYVSRVPCHILTSAANLVVLLEWRPLKLPMSLPSNLHWGSLPTEIKLATSRGIAYGQFSYRAIRLLADTEYQLNLLWERRSVKNICQTVITLNST